MVIYANTHHNSAEEVRLVPMEGNCTSQGFYGSDGTLLHLRGCGFPYKLALERPRVAISPQTICSRITPGCLLNTLSSASIIDPLNQKPLAWGLRICILILPPTKWSLYILNETIFLNLGPRGQYHLHLGYAHNDPLLY